MLCWYFLRVPSSSPPRLPPLFFSTVSPMTPGIEQAGSPTEGAGSLPTTHTYPCMPNLQLLLLPSGLHLKSHGEGGLLLIPALEFWSQSATLGVAGHFPPRTPSHYIVSCPLSSPWAWGYCCSSDPRA